MIRPMAGLRLAGLAGMTILASCGASASDSAAGSATSRSPVAPAPASAPNASAPVLSFSGEQTQGGWIRGHAPTGTIALTLDAAAVNVAPDGTFFAGFDRDAGPVATLTAQLADGRTVSHRVPVSPRAWKIENVNVARRTGGATEEFMALRRPELARINAARAIHSDAQGWRQQFIWPVRGRISGLFGSQRVYRGEPGSYHSGTDVATGESGTPFVAPADGVVILAAEQPFTLEGRLLMIDHGNGLNSAFLHCSDIMVKTGDHVRQGQPIGRIGMTGRATGPHLHWSMKWGEARLDPMLFTGPMN